MPRGGVEGLRNRSLGPVIPAPSCGERQQDGGHGILVLDQQQPRHLIGAKEKLTEAGFVDGQAKCEDSRSMSMQQCFDTAIEALGAVVRQHHQPRNAPAARGTGLLVYVLQAPLFGREYALGAFETTDDSARGERALQYSFEIRRDFDLRHAHFRARP